MGTRILNIVARLVCASLLLTLSAGAPFGLHAARAQEDNPAPPGEAPTEEESALTRASVQQRIRSVQASETLDDAQKTELLSQYGRVAEALESAEEYRTSAEPYEEALRTAVDEVQSIRAGIAALPSSPLADLSVTAESGADAIDEQLQEIRGQESSTSLALGEVDGRLAEIDARPPMIRAREAAVREAIAVLLNAPMTPAAEQVLDREAEFWLRRSSLDALNAEAALLQLELESAPSRRSLLEARRDQLRVELERVRPKIDAMTQWLAEARQRQTVRIASVLSSTLSEAIRSHPRVVEELAANQRLADSIAAQTELLNAASADDAEAANQLAQVQRRLSDTRQQLDVGGMSQALGRYLAEERRALTQRSTYPNDSSRRRAALAEAGLRGIELNQSRRELVSPDAYVSERMEGVDGAGSRGVRRALRMLANQRRELVQQAIEVNHDFRRTLSELEYRESQRHLLIEEFNALLAERLLWVRNAGSLGLAELRSLPSEAGAAFDLRWWLSAAKGVVQLCTDVPAFWLCLILFGLFFARRKSLIQRLRDSSSHVGDAAKDELRATLVALGLSLTLAAPGALLTFFAGWLMGSQVETTEAAQSVGAAL
ncbi:MAG: potassium efflux system protein, partial [Polyangiales bacterium]